MAWMLKSLPFFICNLLDHAGVSNSESVYGITWGGGNVTYITIFYDVLNCTCWHVLPYNMQWKNCVNLSFEVLTVPLMIQVLWTPDYPEGGTRKLTWNISKYLPIYIASYPKKLEFSTVWIAWQKTHSIEWLNSNRNLYLDVCVHV